MKHIGSKYLNLRTEPLVKPSTLIVGLPFGQPVSIKQPSTRSGWFEVDTTYQGNTLSGHISGRFLRDPISDMKEAALAVAAKEWDRFKRGKGKEYNSPYDGYVGEYWTARGYNWTGQDRDRYWSAACISWFYEKAGYKGFTFAVAHSKYINEAISARDTDDSRDFWGYRITEEQPQIGDLIARRRTSATYIDYDYAAGNDQFPSHTDMVVSIGDDYVDAVGGNVSNSVSITRYKTLASGKLDSRGGRVFALLQNRR
ncbi:MAG: DUF2272 domain-containing protein [Pseudomonadota bacterium]